MVHADLAENANLTYDPAPFPLAVLRSPTPRLSMSPASLSPHCVWLHWLWPIFALRQALTHWQRRSVHAALLVGLLGIGWGSHSSSTTLFAAPPGEAETSENQEVFFTPLASTADSPWTRSEVLTADFTTPLPRDSADRRSSSGQTSGQNNSWLGHHLKLVADEPEDPAKPFSEPDISEPGPDMGDYPNSAFTLPKGRAYIEFAPLNLQTADRYNSASYNAPFLLRYGITDDVELRLFGSGITTAFDPGNTVSGFSPLIIDTKIHMWDARMEQMIPAASLEVYVQTNWGSPAFQGGVEPSINLNLDFPVAEKTNIEMTFGYTGIQDALFVVTGDRFFPRLGHKIPKLHQANLNVNQFSYQWAIEQQVTEKFQIFVHGYFNGPVYLQSGPGKVIGTGWFYRVSKRSMIFSSYNAGMDSATAPFTTQLGVAFAL